MVDSLSLKILPNVPTDTFGNILSDDRNDRMAFTFPLFGTRPVLLGEDIQRVDDDGESFIQSYLILYRYYKYLDEYRAFFIK